MKSETPHARNLTGSSHDDDSSSQDGTGHTVSVELAGGWAHEIQSAGETRD